MFIRYLLIASVFNVAFGFLFSSAVPNTENRAMSKFEPGLYEQLGGTSLSALVNKTLSSWIFKFFSCMIFDDHNIRSCANRATKNLPDIRFAYPNQGSGWFDTLKNHFYGDSRRTTYPQEPMYQYVQYDAPYPIQYHNNFAYQQYPNYEQQQQVAARTADIEYGQNAAQTYGQIHPEGSNYIFGSKRK